MTATGRAALGRAGGGAGGVLARIPAAAVLANCSMPEAMEAALAALKPWACPSAPMPTGFPRSPACPAGTADGAPAYCARHDLTPERYAAFRAALGRAWARPVGGCCEVGPAHIRHLAAAARGRATRSHDPGFRLRPPDVPLPILHEDRHILVVDKPAGLLSVPGKLEGREDCLVSRLQAARWDALLVHRLDCDTSGVMIFARTKKAQGFLGQEFEQRRAKKTYVARVAGEHGGRQRHVDLPLGADWPNRPRQMVSHEHGRPAVTDWQVIGRAPGETRVRLTPH
jgi:tRNA pseudouridine32 synthase/23S rRNA pseudouridine746 synthase